MDMLKKFFPYSFGAADVKTLVIKIVVYLIVPGLVATVLNLLPLVGDVLAWLVGIYGTVGLVLTVLDYLKVLK